MERMCLVPLCPATILATFDSTDEWLSDAQLLAAPSYFERELDVEVKRQQ